MKKHQYPTVLSIAGFDGSGGAGLQADIKTISALGCYATSVLTALPVQNTSGVRRVYPIPAEAVREQLEAILEDIFPSAIKIGMVYTTELVEIIVSTLAQYPKVPIVFDPVMVSSSGHPLMEDKTMVCIREKLFPITDILTPNMDEAALLTNSIVKTPEDMRTAAEIIKSMGSRNVLLKGGHLESSTISSLLLANDQQLHLFETERIETKNTHGTGCTLSAAIASYIAQGKNMLSAVTLGQQYVHKAIEAGKDVEIGKGRGSLNHFFSPQKSIKF